MGIRIVFIRSYDQFEVGDTGEIVGFINENSSSLAHAIIVGDKNGIFTTSLLHNFKRI
jgi:hypothetical protein